MLGGVERAPAFITSEDSKAPEFSVGQINWVIEASAEDIDSVIGERSNSAGDCSKSDVG